jgi:hypothetical protein
MHDYWTEYLDSLLDDDRFLLVCSKEATTKTYKGRELPLFDPSKHKVILSAGEVFDRTDRNFIICRFQHSPGFATHCLINGYVNLLKHEKEYSSNFAYLPSDALYRQLISTELLPAQKEFYQYEMLSDSRIFPTEIDPMLYKIRDAKVCKKRKSGTGLIALSWKVAEEPVEKLNAIIDTLSKELDITLLLHPLVKRFPAFVENLKIKKYLIGCFRSEMINLYDAHEFVITDGSGSCYEALLRGCKPLRISSFSYHQNNQTLHAAIEEGYLPFQEYSSLSTYKLFDSEPFLDGLFPFLKQYSEKEAIEILKNEILQVAKTTLFDSK